jgi:hypothetical protein
VLRKALRIAFLIFVVAARVSGQALVYEVEDEPLFAVEFPDGWQVDLDFADEARAAGTYTDSESLAIRIVEASPADGAEIWVGLWAVPGARSLDEGLEYAASLNSDLFTDLEVSPPVAKDLNGMAARVLTATAQRDGQAVELIFALFEPRAGAIAAALYVGAAEIWRSYRPELEPMVASLAPAD